MSIGFISRVAVTHGPAVARTVDPFVCPSCAGRCGGIAEVVDADAPALCPFCLAPLPSALVHLTQPPK